MFWRWGRGNAALPESSAGQSGGPEVSRDIAVASRLSQESSQDICGCGAAFLTSTQCVTASCLRRRRPPMNIHPQLWRAPTGLAGGAARPHGAGVGGHGAAPRFALSDGFQTASQIFDFLLLTARRANELLTEPRSTSASSAPTAHARSADAPSTGFTTRLWSTPQVNPAGEGTLASWLLAGC